jgi:putative nucleotidyltransferase with HDIG domain
MATRTKRSTTAAGSNGARYADRARPQTRGTGRGGHRLAEAFLEVEGLPALAESRERLMTASTKRGASVGEISDAVESDVALAIGVLRAAANTNGRGRLAGVPNAVERLSPEGVRYAVEGLETYEFFEPVGEWHTEPERFRRHAVATRIAAERIGEVGRIPGDEELAAAALLHDVGRLVLLRMYPGYGEMLERPDTPEQRVAMERRELGVDHALVGGVLVRRWGLPPGISRAIQRHHAADADGLAAAVALADMVARHSHGEQISPERLAEVATASGVGEARARAVLYEFPHSARAKRRRPPEPCPLSARELDALRGLADGNVYKEIAEELSLSASTVRTHLHNVYRKIGAVDRAQAVLIARDKGWI